MLKLENLVAAIESIGLSLTARQLEQFANYQEFLLAWNKRINLTAPQSAQKIQVRHFADSLTCYLVTGDLSGQSMIDVGSGAGFPGLPMRILFPELRLTLLESVAKKANFLRALVAELELENVNVISDRAETLGHDPAYRQQYDWAVARAVAHLSPLAEYLLPFCRIGGFALAQKGTRVQEELTESQRAISLLGGGMPRLIPVHLPGENEAFLVVVEKLGETPDKYPRRAGMPVKRPL